MPRDRGAEREENPCEALKEEIHLTEEPKEQLGRELSQERITKELKRKCYLLKMTER